MTSLTIQLDDRTNGRLLELSRREHKKPEVLVTDAVKGLFESVPEEEEDESNRQAWFQEARRRLDEYQRGEGTNVTREESMARARRMIEEAKRARA